MLVPNAFKELGRCFHQDVLIVHPSLEAAALEVLSGFTKDQRRELHRFLVMLLDDSHNNGDLRGAWRKTSAQIRFRNSRDLRAFLLKVQSLVERQVKG